VLIFTAAKPDGRRKLFQALQKRAVCLSFPLPYEEQILQWIERRRRARSGDRARRRLLLAMGIGPQVRELANEIEKLSILLDERTTITAEDVAALSGTGRADPYGLPHAVFEGRLPEALDQLRQLLDRGEEAVRIVVQLGRHLASCGG